MKQIFLLSMLVAAVVGGIGYLLWIMFKTLYTDWMLTKDVPKIAEESRARREQREQENRQRLDNGCEHLFGETLGGFPPFACRKCGLEQARPSGPCDHVWRLSQDAIPCAVCEKCGKKYRAPKDYAV